MSELGFGGQLEALRTASGMSRARLASRADVSYAYIQQLETGKRKMPGGAILAKIADALGTTSEGLLSGTAEPAAVQTQPDPSQLHREELLADILHVCQGLETSTLETVRQVIAGFSKLEVRSSTNG